MGFQEDANTLSTFEEIYDATFDEISGASLVAQVVKSLPAMRETWVRSLGQEDPLGKKWQPPPVLLPGKSPMDRGGRPQSMGLQRVRHD